MTTRDWQAAVAGGPPWEGKEIIISTLMIIKHTIDVHLIRCTSRMFQANVSQCISFPTVGNKNDKNYKHRNNQLSISYLEFVSLANGGTMQCKDLFLHNSRSSSAMANKQSSSLYAPAMI